MNVPITNIWRITLQLQDEDEYEFGKVESTTVYELIPKAQELVDKYKRMYDMDLEDLNGEIHAYPYVDGVTFELENGKVDAYP